MVDRNILGDSGETLPWQSWLSDCRRNIGEVPRRLDPDVERQLLVHPPWITKLRLGDSLAKLIQNGTLRNLFRNGEIVWGCVVQANQDLFEPAPSTDSYVFDRPGEILFSLPGGEPASPDFLRAIANKIGGLRRAQGLDAELQSWANYLNEETTRVVGKPVPQRFAGLTPCFVSTTLFRRSYLPDGVLWSPVLPIVVAVRPPFFAIPLPVKYWSPSLVKWFTGV